MAKQCWKVVGGGDAGGILVRIGQKTSSAALDERLATGALVEEQELQGERLSYKKLSGAGPDVGWVSIKLKGKELLEKAASAETSTDTTLVDEVKRDIEKALGPLEEEREDELPVLVEEEPEMPLPASYEGGPLPKIPRDLDHGGLPTFADLPASLQKKYKDKIAKKKDKLQPRMRLFIIYGVTDSMADWSEFLMSSPLWVDVAVYECKAHGVRATEPFDTSVEARSEDAWEALKPALSQHAKEGSIEGAPFALMAHSSGAQLMCLLARHMRRKLNLEPCHVFVLDRPPPSIQTLSHAGYQVLCKDPIIFFDAFYKDVVGQLRNADKNEMAAKMAERWETGMRIAHEHRCREAYHVFRCPITVFIQDYEFRRGKMFKENKGSMSREDQKDYWKRCFVTASHPESTAEWDFEDYQHWKKWTTGPCDFKQIENTNHSTIKYAEEVVDSIYAALKKVVY